MGYYSNENVDCVHYRGLGTHGHTLQGSPSSAVSHSVALLPISVLHMTVQRFFQAVISWHSVEAACLQSTRWTPQNKMEALEVTLLQRYSMHSRATMLDLKPFWVL